LLILKIYWVRLDEKQNTKQYNTMKKHISLAITLLLAGLLPAKAQLGAPVTAWLQNNTITGRHYVNGNSTPIVDAVLANVQTVQYSNNWTYISTHGIPSYITGPFLDGNPSLASDQNAIFKVSRLPVQNTGTPTPVTMGNIGLFIN
jgi:hypothetical protein